MDYSNLFVVAMGVGTVFVGLICLIVLVWVMGKICREAEKDVPVAPPAPVQAVSANGGEIVAAISAAIAEELGTDVNAIRITSIERV